MVSLYKSLTKIRKKARRVIIGFTVNMRKVD